MRAINNGDALLYWEESTGFLYEEKTLGNKYYVPLNFCTLDCNLKKIKEDGTAKRVQQHPRRVQPRRQPKLSIGRFGIRSKNSVRTRAQGRFKVHGNKSVNGNGEIQKGNHRRNSIHRVFGTSPTSIVYGVRLKTRAEVQTKEIMHLSKTMQINNPKPYKTYVR